MRLWRRFLVALHLPRATIPMPLRICSAAFQQQLRLKLEPTRAPVDVMVIDKVERPSEN